MSNINISPITINEEDLKTVILQKIASDMVWRFDSDIKDKIEKSIKMIDQATINRMVTEYLVAEHLGKMRGDE